MEIYHGMNQLSLLSQQKTAYTAKLPVPLRPGVVLFFQGVLPSDYKRYAKSLSTS